MNGTTRASALAVTALLAGAAPAMAFNDWTGFSGGVQLGYGNVSTTGPALEGDGILYGVRAAYDFDFGDFVVGLGGQYDFTDIDIGGATTLESVARVGLRGGIGSDQALFYATGGYAYATTSQAAIGDSGGWFGGVGVEFLVTDTVTVGTEVLYHQFNNFDLGTLEADATTISASVNFRF